MTWMLGSLQGENASYWTRVSPRFRISPLAIWMDTCDSIYAEYDTRGIDEGMNRRYLVYFRTNDWRREGYTRWGAGIHIRRYSDNRNSISMYIVSQSLSVHNLLCLLEVVIRHLIDQAVTNLNTLFPAPLTGPESI